MRIREKRCEDFAELFEENVMLNLKLGDVIIVSSNWFGSHVNVGDEDFKYVASDLLAELTDTPLVVVLVANAPDFIKDPYIELSKRENINGDQYVAARDCCRSDEV